MSTTDRDRKEDGRRHTSSQHSGALRLNKKQGSWREACWKRRRRRRRKKASRGKMRSQKTSGTFSS